MGLIESIAGGDSTAFEQLYDRYSPVLYALLLRILGNTEDAREVLQESLVQAWNNADRFDGRRGSEAAWLIAIARSRGIDRLRSRRTRSERETEAAREISRGSSAVLTRDDAVQNEQKRAVRGALAELPEAQRMALELAYFEGLSQSEIASRLKEPLGTIKTRMQLGMKKLREKLKGVR